MYFKKEGDLNGELISSHDAFGYFLAKGESKKKLEESLKMAFKFLKVDIDEI